jgi:6-pyruvoyl-tetrahydropterin synthase
MVMDFTALKRVYEAAVQSKVDHRYLVSLSNLEAGDMYARVAPLDDVCNMGIEHTTAEGIAEWIAGQINEGLQRTAYRNVVVISVRVWETPSSYATYMGGLG